MTTQSKEVYWLEKFILDFIEGFSQKKQAAKSWLFDSKNRFKILGIITVALGGGYGLAKFYKYATYKPKTKPTPAEEAKKKEQDKKPQAKINNEFFQRLWYLIKIACPNLKSREFYSIITLTFTVIAQSALANYLNSVAGNLMKDLLMQDVDLFLKTLVHFTGVNMIISVVTPLMTYLMDNLSLSFRKNITHFIHDKYYQNIMYYKLKSLDKRINNPDQIITQDVEVLCDKISGLFVDFLSPVSDVIINSVRMTEIIGIGGPLSIIAYLLTSVAVLQIVTPNFTKMSAEVQSREGKFRFLHGRLRINAESIAFYQGDDKERTIVENIFKNLTDYASTVINKNFLFGIVNDYFTKYCPHTIVLIVGGLPTFFGSLRNYEKSDLISVLRYLIAVITFEFIAVGKLIEVFRILLKLSGYTHRVHGLLDVMKDIYKRQREDKTIKGEFADSGDIEFDNVSIVTPADVPLAHRLKFIIKHGKNTVITGPNGSGKSSLFRVLGGLWPLKLGTVKKPGATKQGLNSTDIFYLPQKPYNVIGSLRDQIIYPDQKSKKSDTELQQLLDLVGIGYLSNEGFDTQYDWDKLSRGEQQRLASVRLFYHNPKFAILDECTSCINKDAEEKLYNECKARGITAITISHRPALDKFHDYRLVFDGDGGWIYEEIIHKEIADDEACEGKIIASYKRSAEDDKAALSAK